MKKESYKVGITAVFAEGDSLFSNGIRQNGMMLAKLLKLAGHEVTIINFKNVNRMTKFPWDTNEYKTVNIFDEPLYPEQLDVLIHLHTIPKPSETLQYKELNPNLKVIGYRCGNNYVNDMEAILFKAHETNEQYITHDTNLDAVWYVPQQKLNNHDYISILSRTDSNAIPFVWDPMFIEEHIKMHSGIDVRYTPSNEPKRVSIFEPNINVVKYSVPSILAIEHAYRQRPDLIGFMYASNTYKLIDINLFKGMMNQLDIVKDGKAQFTHRYPIVHYLQSRTDIVVSHQWGNPLNYLYFDVMYLGYPLVHNAHLIADMGFYYNEFDLKDAGNMVVKVAEDYDNIYKEHYAENLKKMQRFMPSNKNLQEDYTNLLHSLFDDDVKNSISWDLDWKTNRYK